MKRTFLSLLLLPAISSGIFAQDRIHTVNGTTYETKVQSIDKQMVSFVPVETAGHSVSKLPRNYISSIEFSDGLVLPFSPDGEIVRDGLAKAPSIKAKGGGVYAEGLVRLTEEETRARLGSERYYLNYLPAKAKFTTGLVQAFTGVAVFGACALMDNPSRPQAWCKEIWFRDTKGSILFRGTSIQNNSPLTIQGRTIQSGKLNPYLVSGEILSAATLVSGIVNVLGAATSIRKAVAGTNKPAPSLSRTKTQYWTGLGMAALGAGALVGGCIDLNNHREWYIEHNPDPRYERHDGDIPVAGPVLALAGSVLLNIGVGEFTVASSRLKGYDNAGRQLSLSAGPCAGGYGLQLTF